MNSRDRYILALSMVDGVGPVLGRQLIAYCGGPENVFKTSKKKLMEIPAIGHVMADKIHMAEPDLLVEKELTFIKKAEVEVISFLSDAYPRRLKNFDDSPMLLFYKGTENLNSLRMVGIVGTRKPSEYGMLMTEKLVEDLLPYNVVIVSGMAYGIDSVAHRKAVELGIPTIGVLGHGLDRIYPSSNTKLSQKMKLHGGLLSEFPSGTKPDRENFPMRNRIIAALSDAIVVVESKARGGSIITAEFANSYNKDVFAFPGKIGDEKSAGCNRLIKIHKAALLENAKDLAYVMRWEIEDAKKNIQQSLFQDFSADETKIMDILRQHKEMDIDKLHHHMEKSMSQLSSLLLQLEFKGVIRSLPGKRYIIR